MLRRGRKAAKRRRHLSNRLRDQQDLALSSNIYLLREMGPTGFLLREEEPEKKDFRVFLGNPHVCNCSTFLKEKELCKHICWILLKKFKLPRTHEYALQLGLVESEISNLLQGIHQIQSSQQGKKDENVQIEEDGKIKQKEIGPDDICPICQEVLLEKRLPVTFCRFGCGNNIHIKCMKILASFQERTLNTSMLKCPLCRKEFAPLKLVLEEFKNSSKFAATSEKVQLDKHLGIPCNSCKQFPIVGKCYKCTECTEYHLCQKCFDHRDQHFHSFTFREKRNQSWRSLEKMSDKMIKYINTKSVIEDNMPHFQKEKGHVCTPKGVVKSLPLLLITKNSHLLVPGYQCRLCLKAFHVGEHLRILPCTHKFHRKCIDRWLFHQCNSCPIDGQVIYNPLTWKETTVNGHAHQSVSNTDYPHQEEPELFIPGTGLILKQNRLGFLPHLPQHMPENLDTIQNPYHNIRINNLNPNKLEESISEKLITEYNVSQHFPRYLQDLPTPSFGKMPSQPFLPPIVHKNTRYSTVTERPYINKNFHIDQSQKTVKKKTPGINREHSRKPNILLSDLNFTVNCGAQPSSTKRNKNCLERVRPKFGRLSKKPTYHSLNTNSSEISLKLEGVQL
ncbi:E3 ubiquitin-protein ligase ZSWIM2 [Suncus etruscus]|uniref:E3 ubiquitin-protein ligase ZSWIM2 n=1 Tax=Suncus etruscus TaxID=109475 RepID=UPI0021100FE9|nr:E3 ubiquitin-protein ligase ZSWIM2 [Suncus etruscus]